MVLASVLPLLVVRAVLVAAMVVHLRARSVGGRVVVRPRVGETADDACAALRF